MATKITVWTNKPLEEISVTQIQHVLKKKLDINAQRVNGKRITQDAYERAISS